MAKEIFDTTRIKLEEVRHYEIFMAEDFVAKAFVARGSLTPQGFHSRGERQSPIHYGLKLRSFTPWSFHGRES